MTPEEAREWMALNAVPFLRAAGHAVFDFDGLDGDRGQLLLSVPSGDLLSVVVPIFLPITAMRAVAENEIRLALRPFEGDCGRGFNSAGRGVIEIGSRGYRANDGWV